MKKITEKQFKKNISTNLKTMMSLNQVSESKLSSVTSISQSAINRIKNGAVCPSLFQAIVIADALSVPLEDIYRAPCDQSYNADYIAIISARSFLIEDKPQILGLIKNKNEWQDEMLGIKVDDSFDCKILNNESIIIFSRERKLYKNGDNLLVFKDGKYVVGSMQNNVIKPIDDLSITISPDQTCILGTITAIETTYIDDKQKIKEVIKSYSSKFLTSFLSIKSDILKFA